MRVLGSIRSKNRNQCFEKVMTDDGKEDKPSSQDGA
jgi:hypothetical protein